jgi:hypothetical protein
MTDPDTLINPQLGLTEMLELKPMKYPEAHQAPNNAPIVQVPKNDLTWEQLVKLESRLEQLERFVKQQKLVRGKNYCANWVWFALFKPIMKKLVGRKRPRADDVDNSSRLKFVPVDDGIWVEDDEWVEADIPNETGLDPLRTCDAYDCAYQHLYHSLPDCRHDGNCRHYTVLI